MTDADESGRVGKFLEEQVLVNRPWENQKKPSFLGL